MKRAPIIPKTNQATILATPDNVSAVPVVDSLIARVGAMTKGNVISLPICGKEVKFTLETIPGCIVAEKTKVWAGNERDQELLSEDALDDLIPSFRLSGQQNPAFGRKVDNLIEVADGSRRRMTAILTACDYRILVGELNNKQMEALCKTGNEYRPTSAYERGKRYAHRLEHEFHGNLSALAEAENISRKIITRCVSTAWLPKGVIALFSQPGELSARAGEQLQRTFLEKKEILLKVADELTEKKRRGVIFGTDEILKQLYDAVKANPSMEKKQVTKRQFIPGATAEYKKSRVIFDLDRKRLPDECISKIEAILEELAQKEK